MIEFNDELTNECKKYYDKLFAKIVLIISVVISLIFIIPSIFLYFHNDLFLIVIVVAIIFPFFVLISLKTKATSYTMPNLVQINDNNEFIIKCKNLRYTKNINEIKCVYDYGKWYLFKVKNSLDVTRFVCQKDLIKVGNIEEFEKLFQGKIIKKYEQETSKTKSNIEK